MNASAESSCIAVTLILTKDVLKRRQAETAAEFDALLPTILPPSLMSYGVASDKAFEGER